MIRKRSLGPSGGRALTLLALTAALAPGLALAQQQIDNPWRAQAAPSQPRFAPPDPQANMVPQGGQGTYAPPNLDDTLSGIKPSAPPPVVTVPKIAASPQQPAPLGTPSATAQQPAPGTVVPPYAGLPLAGGYNYGYLPAQPNSTTTIVVPYGGYPGAGGYPGTGYGYPGYGNPGYGGENFGWPSWGNRNGNNWGGWSPGGSGFPMGGFSPFGFW